MKEWLTFIRERYSLITSIPFMLLFLLAHYAFSNSTLILNIQLVFIAIATWLFFLTLRLFDEIKDFETDKKSHPQRPLVRGLVKHVDLYKMILGSVILEVFLLSTTGISALVGILISILYSLFMFKEFFARNWIRKHLTFYAVTHTFVSFLFSLTLFSAFTTTFLWSFSPRFYLFALINWLLFNVYEFGRKTFTTTEEQVSIDSYSKVFGVKGAVILLLSMAILITLLLFLTTSFMETFASFILLPPLALVGFFYMLYNKDPWGKIYRVTSLVYIGLIYAIIIILK